MSLVTPPHSAQDVLGHQQMVKNPTKYGGGGVISDRLAPHLQGGGAVVPQKMEFVDLPLTIL